MIKIVTDSTCDLPGGWCVTNNVTVVPINIQFGTDTYRDGVDIKPEGFYSRINNEGELPTTSQPSVGQFRETYQTLAADGSNILSIHVTSKLSGTYQAAMLAARQLGHGIQITIVDSLTGSVGLGLMVQEAVRLAEAGLKVSEIVSLLEGRRTEIDVFIMLKDLRCARMSGRVGRLRESLASLLNVKPIVGVDEGSLVSLERVRGRKRGFERMLTMAQEAVAEAPVHLAVAHALDRAHAEHLLAQARARLNCQDSFIADLALSLAVHFGPGTVGLATYPAEINSRG